ncbi:diguanylate cyclase [Leptolyngbya sp. CCNP1308]|uniref:diguanylate cyclase n=1 Tax=Leptolyngbya sp. CCNP1308 TaxID=3110255 RepID=UPI002B20043C|nr:diguanylate cyclase [Leptolyngbya sp. CCNP1308]MEA5451486.1 diguanylate cyclase [Leptolyngbya sp. CCNP1308]
MDDLTGLVQQLQAENARLQQQVATLRQVNQSLQAELERSQPPANLQQIETALSDSEATNQAILRAIPDLLMRIGRDGTCFSFLPPSSDDSSVFLPVEHHLAEILPPDLLADQLRRIEQALTTGELQVWEQQLVKRGQLCHEEVRLVPCSDDECLVIVRDITQRQQMALELGAKIEELDRFFSMSLDLLCIADTDGYFRRLNSAWEKTLGYRLADLENTPFISYVHLDDVTATIEVVSALTNHQEVVSFTNRYRCLDGSYRWLEWRAVPMDGLVYAVARDITDSREMTLQLQTTKEQLELVLEASSEGFSDWNLTTDEIYFSPQWKAMLGYADHELENSIEMWNSTVFEEDRLAGWQLVDNYNSGKVDALSTVYRHRHKNGSTVHIFTRVIHLKDAEGQVVRMVGSHLDITATVGMQQALQTSEMQLSGVLNSSIDGIMAFRAVRNDSDAIVDFEWLLSNPSACAVVGHTAEYLVGKRLLDELPGNKTDGLFDLYVQVVETGESVQRQFHYSHDGIDTWFEAIAVKLGDGFAVTFRDITALKQSRQVLQDVNQQLESRVDELKQRNDEMQRLGEMSDFLQACLTVKEAYQALGTLVAPLFVGSSGAIFILNPSRDRMEIVTTWGPELNSQPLFSSFSPSDCWALRRGRSHQVGPHSLGLRCHHAETAAIASTTLCLPLLAQGETLGLFYLSASEIKQPTQQLARAVAEQVALALANLQLRETLQYQSIRDPLTGLYNRRYLEEALTQAIERAQRHRHPIGVIMLDIDHFKRFNDVHGHDAGDRVLEAVGQLLRDSVRGSDIACRYGGEEMTLVLPEAPPDIILARAEAIRYAIGQLRVSYNSMTLEHLSVSLGVASFPAHGATGLDVVKAADVALYQAKSRGRNQVVVYSACNERS